MRSGCSTFSSSTYIVMVFAAEVDSVNIHATVIGPVVRERDDELDSDLGRGIHNLIEAGDIDGRGPVRIPPLEDDLGRACPLPSVLRQASGHVGPVLVVESPRAENSEASLSGCCQTLLNVVLGLASGYVSVSLRLPTQISI